MIIANIYIVITDTKNFIYTNLLYLPTIYPHFTDINTQGTGIK